MTKRGHRYGQIKSGLELGKNKKNTYIWLRCPTCRKGRWLTTSSKHDEKYVSISHCRPCSVIRAVDRFWQENEPEPYERRNRKNNTVDIFVPLTDPYVCMCSQTNRYGGWLFEHRYVMAKHIGRALTSEETVHHRNGIATDNRIDNLELWGGAHGSGQRLDDLLHNYLRLLPDDDFINILNREIDYRLTQTQKADSFPIA